jgi:hypothetical protein
MRKHAPASSSLGFADCPSHSLSTSTAISQYSFRLFAFLLHRWLTTSGYHSLHEDLEAQRVPAMTSTSNLDLDRWLEEGLPFDCPDDVQLAASIEYVSSVLLLENRQTADVPGRHAESVKSSVFAEPWRHRPPHPPATLWPVISLRIFRQSTPNTSTRTVRSFGPRPLSGAALIWPSSPEPSTVRRAIAPQVTLPVALRRCTARQGLFDRDTHERRPDSRRLFAESGRLGRVHA